MNVRAMSHAAARTACLILVAAGPAAAQTPPAGQAPAVVPVVVTAASPDVQAGTITVTGQHFGPQPFVTLNLIPLNVQSATDSRIVAVAPLDQIPPDTYLLTVSRGTADQAGGSIDVVLGATGGAAGQAPAAASTDVTAAVPSATDAAARVGDHVITVGDVDAEWRRTESRGISPVGP